MWLAPVAPPPDLRLHLNSERIHQGSRRTLDELSLFLDAHSDRFSERLREGLSLGHADRIDLGARQTHKGHVLAQGLGQRHRQRSLTAAWRT